MPVVTLVLLLARLILAGVFVVSAGAKLLDRSGSRAAVQDFGVPATLSGVVAAGLPVAELLCAGLLMSTDPGASAGAALSALLLASFTVAIVVNLLRGRRPDCHCFGQLSSAPTGWPSVVRNGGLLVLALLPLIATDPLPSVPAQLATYSAADLAMGASLSALAIAVLVLGALFGSLLRRYGDVLLRLETLESTSERTPRAPLPAPSFELPELDGEMVSLVNVMAEQRPVLLVFISPSCTMCADLLPDLQRWQLPEHPLSVVVVSEGTGDENRAKLGDTPDLRVLLQSEREVALAYGLRGTPGAFLLGVDGLIAGTGAYGVDAIHQLHESVLAAMNAGTDHAGHAHQFQVKVGDPVPAISLQTEAGESVDLAQYADDETVLLFWDANCGFCSQILADVAELEGAARVVLMARSDPAGIRASGLRSALLRDLTFSVGNALHVPGTPAAVVVRDRAIASAPAVGGPDVLALLARYSHAVQR